MIDGLIRWSLRNRGLVLALAAGFLAWGGYLVSTIPVDVLPDLTLPGRVTRIAPMATPGQGGTNYTVVIAVGEADVELRWGMTAYPAFED